jgi:hypothetical protein
MVLSNVNNVARNATPWRSPIEQPTFSHEYYTYPQCWVAGRDAQENAIQLCIAQTGAVQS